MSFEGYYQVLCSHGHEIHENDFDEEFDAAEWKCPYCNGPSIWYNVVNETNGTYDEYGARIDGYVVLKEKTPAQKHTCTCGHTHIRNHATYHVPQYDGRIIQR